MLDILVVWLVLTTPPALLSYAKNTLRILNITMKKSGVKVLREIILPGLVSYKVVCHVLDGGGDAIELPDMDDDGEGEEEGHEETEGALEELFRKRQRRQPQLTRPMRVGNLIGNTAEEGENGELPKDDMAELGDINFMS